MPIVTSKTRQQLLIDALRNAEDSYEYVIDATQTNIDRYKATLKDSQVTPYRKKLLKQAIQNLAKQ